MRIAIILMIEIDMASVGIQSDKDESIDNLPGLEVFRAPELVDDGAAGYWSS
jgi:hypothetical protein